MEVDAEHGRGMCQRRRDIVAVADVGNRLASDRAEPFLERQEIGDCLARMLLICQCVDDVQSGCGAGEFFEHAL